MGRLTLRGTHIKGRELCNGAKDSRSEQRGQQLNSFEVGSSIYDGPLLYRELATLKRRLSLWSHHHQNTCTRYQITLVVVYLLSLYHSDPVEVHYSPLF